MAETPTTTSPPSTSTPAPRSSPPVRVKVAPKPQEQLTAFQALDELRVVLPHGLERRVFPGEWVVSRQGQAIDVLAASSFDQFYEIKTGGLTIPPLAQATLEQRLGIGAAQSVRNLLQAVDRVVDLRIGNVRIEFTPGQMEELKARADKNGWTVKEEVEKIVSHLAGEMFWNA
jgi:hypothetical protein